MRTKVEKILSAKEWTFGDLTNMSQLVRDISEEVFTGLEVNEKLNLIWELDIHDDEHHNIYTKIVSEMTFGKYFYVLVTDQIQLQVASILQEKLLTANVNFGNNKNKEEIENEIPKGSMGGKSSEKRKTDEASHSEE